MAQLRQHLEKLRHSDAPAPGQAVNGEGRVLGRSTFYVAALTAAIFACTSVPAATTDTDPNPTTPQLATTTSTAPSVRISVIVDYSPTVSDVGGLLYLLSHPQVDVKAVTIPGTGEADCELGVDITQGLLTMMGQSGVPVGCTDEAPAHARSWPAGFLQGNSNLRVGLPIPESLEYTSPASELLVETVLKADRPVNLYAVAPLTNLAEALRANPEISQLVDRVVVMGGAVGVAGNTDNAAAEWNFFIDAASARQVLASDLPVELVTLDATSQVPVPSWYPNALARASGLPHLDYLSGLLEQFPGVTDGGYYFWDELAAVVLTREVAVTTEEHMLDVAVGASQHGRTTSDEGGYKTSVVTGVKDAQAFYEEFLSTLAGQPLEMVVATEAESAYLQAVADSLVSLAEAFTAMDKNFGLDPSGDYQPEAASEAISIVMDAFEAQLETISALDAPESLASLHVAFLAELQGDVDQRETVLDGLLKASDWPQALAVLNELSDGQACLDIAEKSFRLGQDLLFSCVP